MAIKGFKVGSTVHKIDYSAIENPPDYQGEIDSLSEEIANSAELTEDNVLEVKNANGVVLFSVDLSDLGGGSDRPKATGITAVWIGGMVEVGTEILLSRLIVTATYSDGSEQELTDGYTVSGTTVAEVGDNVFTVTYKTFAADFTVVGYIPVRNLFEPFGFASSSGSTDYAFENNSVSLTFGGTSSNAARVHINTEVIEEGKKYTAFFDNLNEDVVGNVGIQIASSNSETSMVGIIKYRMDHVPSGGTGRVVFEKPTETYINFIFGVPVYDSNVGKRITWSNIAIYEGELTERPF